MSPRTFLVLSLGLLAGILSHFIARLLPTEAWLNQLPWHKASFQHVEENPMRLLHLILALGATWTCFALRRGLRLWLLMAVATALCFTAGMTLAKLGMAFDSFRAVLALGCGTLVGWIMGLSPLAQTEQLKQYFGDTVGSLVLAKIMSSKSRERYLAHENRPASVLTFRVCNSAEFQSGQTPEAYFALAQKMSEHIHSFLIRRGAYVPPGGTFDTKQAVFGIPVGSAYFAREALATASLLRTSLIDLFGEQSPALQFAISIVTGNLSCGLTEKRYAVFGSLLEEGRDLAKTKAEAEAVEENPIVMDDVTQTLVKTAPEAQPEPQAKPEPAPETEPKTPKKGKLPADRRKLKPALETPDSEENPAAPPLKVTVSPRTPSARPAQKETRKAVAQWLHTNAVKVSLRTAEEIAADQAAADTKKADENPPQEKSEEKTDP